MILMPLLHILVGPDKLLFNLVVPTLLLLLDWRIASTSQQDGKINKHETECINHP
jgi:hypothetical protein